MVGYAVAGICLGLGIGYLYKFLLLKLVNRQGDLYFARQKAAKWGFWSAVFIIGVPLARLHGTLPAFVMKIGIWIWVGLIPSLLYLFVCFVVKKIKQDSGGNSKSHPAMLALFESFSECAEHLESIDCLDNNLDGCDAKTIAKEFLKNLKKSIKHKWEKKHIQDFIASYENGHSPESFIYNALTHMAADQLESGRHHVYRGVLGSRGLAYKLIFDHSIERSVKLGIYTMEWADTNLIKPVENTLKSVG